MFQLRRARWPCIRGGLEAGNAEVLEVQGDVKTAVAEVLLRLLRWYPLVSKIFTSLDFRPVDQMRPRRRLMRPEDRIRRCTRVGRQLKKMLTYDGTKVMVVDKRLDGDKYW